jgi:phosphatidylglycerophosphate synthase
MAEQEELDGSYGAALRRLRGAQKTSKGAPLYSLYVNRRLGRFLAAAAYRLGLTPNQVTVISALLSLCGIAVIATVPPTWTTGVVVALALALGYAFDSADGQLARLRGGGSVAGEWLDHMIDSAKIVALHLAVLVGAVRFTPLVDSAWLLVPLGFTVIASVTFFGMILNEQLRRVHGVGRALVAVGTTNGPFSAVSALKAPTDYGLLCVSFLLMGSYSLFFGLYTLLMAGCGIYLATASVKWFRDMTRLDAERRTSGDQEMSR